MIIHRIDNLNNLTTAELATAFVGLPPGVTHLDLSKNYLFYKSGSQLIIIFSSIPGSVTYLDLSENSLYRKIGADLMTVFAGISVAVTHLDLSRNLLYRKTGLELAIAFGSMQAGVKYLDLSNNYLFHKTGAELAIAFGGMPATIAHLDLSKNYLGYKTGAQLATDFAGLPAGIMYLDLSRNDLHSKSANALIMAFASIRAGTTVSFKNDALFVNKTHAERDALLVKLRKATWHLNLDLSNNGESDIQRALAPMACFLKKPRIEGGHIPVEIITHILSFLGPLSAFQPAVLNQGLSQAYTMISERPSLNISTPIGQQLSSVTAVQMDRIFDKIGFGITASFILITGFSGALILANIVAPPVEEPILLASALITTSVCLSGFFAYSLKNASVALVGTEQHKLLCVI